MLTIDDIALTPETREMASHLLEKLQGVQLPTPTGWHVLVLQWVRPTVSKSSNSSNAFQLHIPETVQKEDQYQGRCGLVLAVGADAYRDAKFLGGAWCKPGDWVSWRNMESAASRLTYNGVVIARLADDTIVDTGIDPRLVS